MLAEAEKICSEHDIRFEILQPLVEETVKKVFSDGAMESQTGPALRGDKKTIDYHLQMLENNPGNDGIISKDSEDIWKEKI